VPNFWGAVQIGRFSFMQKNNHVLVETWFARGNVLADWFRKLTTRGTIVIIEAEK
jgi:hypothetical protein